jgi:hypothetical protein
MIRAICYVDGFNLYHGLHEDAKAKPYRWLNLWALAESKLLPGHELKKVVYFTSIPPWDNSKASRHKTYIDALKFFNVEVVEGRFQRDPTICRAACKETFPYYSEKLTDVHIATRLLVDAQSDQFDWAYLISGDADQVPAIKAVKKIAPEKRIYVLFPPRRNAAELSQTAHRHESLGWKAFRDCQLPEVIQSGKRVIRRPMRWDPGAEAEDGTPKASSENP